MGSEEETCLGTLQSIWSRTTDTGANGFISRKNMDLFSDIIVSLLPVMIVCRLPASKSWSCVDIVLILLPLGVNIRGMVGFILLAGPQQQIAMLSVN